VVYYFTGASEDQAKYKEWLADRKDLSAHHDEDLRPFSVLIAKAKPAEVARKVAARFYSKGGAIQFPVLQGERTEVVENTILYSPDSGARFTEARPFNLMFKTYVGPATGNGAGDFRPVSERVLHVPSESSVWNRANWQSVSE
jgi:hypothetical protein